VKARTWGRQRRNPSRFEPGHAAVNSERVSRWNESKSREKRRSFPRSSQVDLLVPDDDRSNRRICDDEG
jgi:hypothetical protein